MEEKVWIIKHINSGEYVCSKRLTVKNIALARTFSDFRMAEAYMNECKFSNGKCELMPYHCSNADLNEEELNETERELDKYLSEFSLDFANDCDDMKNDLEDYDEM